MAQMEKVLVVSTRNSGVEDWSCTMELMIPDIPSI
jgi:hypothetical protein